MIVTSLYGGLGNQLFQYATARALAIRNDTALTLDLSWFDRVHLAPETTQRKYSLAPFRLPPRVQYYGTGISSPGLIQRLSAYFSEGRNIYRESSFPFNEHIQEWKPPLWLDGHWQSPKYFSDITDVIKGEIGTVRELSDKSRRLYEEISTKEAICLHVRRGDYVTSPSASQFHGLCSLDYYTKGVEITAGDFASPHFYIFSDDPAWIKENFNIEVAFTVVDVNGPDDAHQDLWLMAACKRFVIANSSLSWWGAWLGASQHKKVIYPSRWFLDPSINVTDLFPAEWIRI